MHWKSIGDVDATRRREGKKNGNDAFDPISRIPFSCPPNGNEILPQTTRTPMGNSRRNWSAELAVLLYMGHAISRILGRMKVKSFEKKCRVTYRSPRDMMISVRVCGPRHRAGYMSFQISEMKLPKCTSHADAFACSELSSKMSTPIVAFLVSSSLPSSIPIPGHTDADDDNS